MHLYIYIYIYDLSLIAMLRGFYIIYDVSLYPSATLSIILCCIKVQSKWHDFGLAEE